MTDKLPVLRWGIISTGMISSWFVEDLTIERADARAHHIIQAIGSSSLEKGTAFVRKHIPSIKPSVYGSYEDVFDDPEVDIVYIGTPHAFHRKNCLDAIRAGKHVLCEKAFTLNGQEANEVLLAAKEKGVFVMEAMWTRFFPIVEDLMRKVHREKIIGDIHRVFCDFGLDMGIKDLPTESRLKNPALGAGSLLDICIYALTWGLICLDPGVGDAAMDPVVHSAQVLDDGIDVTSSVLLSYPKTGGHGILTSTTLAKTGRVFARLQGSKGEIEIEGPAAAVPEAFTVYLKENSVEEDSDPGAFTGKREGTRFEFKKPGRGLFWEADAVAQDIQAGRRENALMPWAETIKVMRIMDGVRREGGARFPQDND